MKRLPILFLQIILLFLCESIFAQKEKLSEFYLIQRQYESLSENDSSALPLVASLIKKAKTEKNQLQLFLGYKDARYYSPDAKVKLKYADSAIYVAKASKNDSLLSSAYLSKGVVYYFYLRKYQLALDEYLKAFEKNKKNKDPYYRNKINYHIGVVKSYVGYYRDALSDFEGARVFFESEIKKDMHPNLMFGYQRGYNNALHQMAVCYRNLQDYKRADSVIAIGLRNTWKNKDLKQEHSYFLKEEGINKYHRKDYAGAIRALENSLPELIDINDFAWVTVSYSYLGKANWEKGNVSEAVRYYEKIDSIFNRHTFVLPAVRHVYEDLILYYNRNNNSEKALYYTEQLIKVDNVLEQDFLFLSSKIHRNYDSDRLLQEKERLEREISIRGLIVISIAFLSVFVSFYVLLRIKSRRKGKNSLLGITLGDNSPQVKQEGKFRIRYYSRSGLEKEVVDDILDKLADFEANNNFLEAKITLTSIAEKFGVSHKNLSKVINEYKGVSFSLYISELRINYVTEKLCNDVQYRKYSSTAIAEECGFSSRSNFSTVFSEIKGISFTEYLNSFSEGEVVVKI
ncbi:helix-turn-helix domain-containing protein [Sphingobacterium siyangense]|uniref:helix-turn-helix domain-containing protein n=1 Tax=Sphingobacterium siyangense TaxID=459529 RepID=UPI002FDD40FC